MVFKNRQVAGQQLAKVLTSYRGQSAVVLALPRGGVVVAAEVARHLQLPLGLVIARKITHPASPELAIGAVTQTGPPVWSDQEYPYMGKQWRNHQLQLARQETSRQQHKYQGHQPAIEITDKVAIIVDDGLATGLTMLAAIHAVRLEKPQQVVVAVPVAPRSLPAEITRLADEVVVLYTPEPFMAVGTHYEQFEQVSDEEVRQLLAAYRKSRSNEPLDLAAMNALLATIKQYPVSGRTIASQAKRLNAPSGIVAFFESIPSIKFRNKTEIMRRSDQVELIMEAELDEPPEQLRSYD